MASEFEIDRRTVDKLLTDIQPSGTYSGKPVYRMLDVAFTLGQYKGGGSVVTGMDPEDMDPKSRKDWYDGEDKRLSVAAKKRELISVKEMGDALAMVFDSLKTFVVTLPDVLERDVDLNPEQVQKMIDIGDKLLADFVEKLVADAEGR